MIDRTNVMIESNADTDQEALESWYKPLLDHTVKEMVRIKAVTGVAVQASAAWMLPYEILIAKVWGINQESDFIWSVSIDKFIADYVAGTVAPTPREAARHFSMKWQMDADRLLGMDEVKAPVAKPDLDLKAYSKQLIQHAETLYDLTNRDDVWEQLQTSAG
jgi:uncharacterized protein DUF4826